MALPVARTPLMGNTRKLCRFKFGLKIPELRSCAYAAGMTTSM